MVTRLTILMLTALMALRTEGANYVASGVEPPWVQREFRGMWIATVGNIDWPSKPGLTVAQQKNELLKILDCAQRLNFNAVIFQARPIGDALYDSKLEPWSYYLTGQMGRAPAPYYDPLAFAVAEAHRRGLELHVWFSPYRVGPPTGTFPMSASHITKTRPEWVRKMGTQLWLDPGEPGVQDYTLRVIMDVVRRYDIDGVHFDDRLGYPEPDPQHRTDFPDGDTYRRLGRGVPKETWRRENVNTIVRRIYQEVKAAKSWVKVGIAPFGIWQNGVPAQIKGEDAYSILYTDSRKWLAEGWLDYCSPQLYWPIEKPETSFSVLLNWWREQNVKQRNLWPGLNTVRAVEAWPPGEIPGEIEITREWCDGAAGEIHYSATAIVNNSGNISSVLARGVYAKPAIVPASPWLEETRPGRPSLRVDGTRAVWDAPAGSKIAVWVWQVRDGGQWQTSILSGETRGATVPGPAEIVALMAVDRCGVASAPVVLQRETGSRK